MSRTKQRESIVTLLYLQSMGGDVDPALFNETVIYIANTVTPYLPTLDRIISANLVDWTIDRLNYVDLAIIRYAVYEMKYTQTPAEIVIDEAIELTKRYTNLDDNKAKAFNNKLLDNIRKSLELPGK
jgi:transcription antitermination protein NusB